MNNKLIPINHEDIKIIENKYELNIALEQIKSEYLTLKINSSCNIEYNRVDELHEMTKEI